jgi:hypothetical protein
MIPDGNDVYGQVTAPMGLELVLQAVRRVTGEGKGHLYRSQFSGATTLRFSTENVDFESTPLDDGRQHLFNGAVGGSLVHVTTFARSLSAMLADLGIENRFEVYDDENNLVQVVTSEAAARGGT